MELEDLKLLKTLLLEFLNYKLSIDEFDYNNEITKVIRSVAWSIQSKKEVN